ncbi:MAG: PEP-CTERM system TPR-repeat protein PrsT [Proteobacteria bacterium]|nr:PEP-CTERM system TPR-repeat protein PrsT [Pseudomonadota bacterium]
MSSLTLRSALTALRAPALVLLMCCGPASSAAFAAVQGANGQAARYYQDASGRFARKDFAGAIIQARNAIQQEPRLLAAHLLLGKALLKDGQAAAAEAEFERALEFGAGMAEIAQPYGTALMMFGKSEKLLQRIRPDGLSAGPRAEVLAMRATAHADLGNMPEAFRAIEAARQADPKSLAPLRAEIDLALRDRNGARARKALDTALGMAPADPQLLHLKGTLLQSGGDVRGALDYFGKALAADPRQLDALIARASLLLDLQRPDEAMRDLDLAGGLVQREPRVAYLRSLVYAARGDSKASRAQLEEVTALVDILPDDFVTRQPPLLMLGGLASYATARGERARMLLERYVQRMPNDPAGRKLLANIYLEAGDSARVADLLEPMLRSGDVDPQALTTLAALRMQQRRYREAAEALEAAARVSGDHPGIMAQRGFALLGSQQSDLGLQALRRAFDKEPRQINVASALSTLYLRRGDHRAALQVAETLVKGLPGEGLAYNLLGAVQAASGRPVEARNAYLKAVALAPGLVPAQLNLARMDVAEERLDAARQRLTALLARQPQHVQAMTELARVEQRAGRIGAAQTLLEQAWAKAPGDVQVGLELLAVYRPLNKPAAALVIARQLTAARPDDPVVTGALGRAALATGDLATARAAFSTLARLVGKDAERLVEVGRLQLQAGAPIEAAASAEKALAARAGFEPALVLQAEAELAAGHVPRAEGLQQALARRTANGAEALRLAGDIALARRQPAEARRLYLAALGKSPSAPLVLQAVNASFRAGEGDKGVTLLEDWLRAHPDDVPVHAAAAEAYLRLNRLGEARKAYEWLIARDPQNAEVANNLAQVLLRQNDRGAVAMAERAARAAPGDANVLDTLGWVRVRNGVMDGGLQNLRDASQRAPESRDIRYHLAWALDRIGRKDEARAELAAALRAGGEFDSAQEAQQLRRSLGL